MRVIMGLTGKQMQAIFKGDALTKPCRSTRVWDLLRR